jgi:hypothetical protein
MITFCPPSWLHKIKVLSSNPSPTKKKKKKRRRRQRNTEEPASIRIKFRYKNIAISNQEFKTTMTNIQR